MPSALKNIAVFARKDGIETVEILSSLQTLLTPYSVVWEAETAQQAGLTNVDTVDYADLGKNRDLIIVVGGDGSILRCASTAVKHQTPMIGINKGRLGFLTDIRPNELSTRLQAVLDGEYWTAKRFLLDTSVMDIGGEKVNCGIALNDVILYPGESLRMLDFEVYVDDQFLSSQRADGLIVATPTGSTAYNLSAGGPIIQPNVDAMVMLPMFSHSLTDRPIIIPSDSQIKIMLAEQHQAIAHLSCDADDNIEIKPGATITISKANKTIELLHPLDYDYYESLRNKLHWGKRLTN